jgi:hypothetical protein
MGLEANFFKGKFKNYYFLFFLSYQEMLWNP